VLRLVLQSQRRPGSAVPQAAGGPFAGQGGKATWSLPLGSFRPQVTGSRSDAADRANFARWLVDFAGRAVSQGGGPAAVAVFARFIRYFRLRANTAGVGISVAKHTQMKIKNH